MQILGLLGMYFDAVVVLVTNFSLLFRFALAILWVGVAIAPVSKKLAVKVHIFCGSEYMNFKLKILSDTRPLKSRLRDSTFQCCVWLGLRQKEKQTPGLAVSKFPIPNFLF